MHVPSKDSPLTSIWQHLKLWWLSGGQEGILSELFYILPTCYTSSMGTVNKNSLYSPVGPRVCLFVFFLGCMICFYVGVCFVLPWTVESFPFMFWHWRTVINLNEPPSSFLLPPHYCGWGAGSTPSRAIVNQKQCETKGLFMSLVIRYWIGDVQDSQGVSISRNANYNFKAW